MGQLKAEDSLSQESMMPTNIFWGLKNDRHGYGMKEKIFGKDIRAAAKFADWDFAGRHLLAVRWGIYWWRNTRELNSTKGCFLKNLKKKFKTFTGRHLLALRCRIYWWRNTRELNSTKGVYSKTKKCCRIYWWRNTNREEWESNWTVASSKFQQ